VARLAWNTVSERFYETGLDRGVFYPKSGPAVPWNGLTSVDENGAESAVAYYIDGRPFLFFPKAKEFEATISAWTYPDEFAEVMGLLEVEDVDGVYFDSQGGNSFDLSYRTLVGNDTEGLDHGYKIHLVYNAVVVPQSITYEPLSSNINPSQFSWQVLATPVQVEGYRATAHVIIDTRHMDAENIAKIEELLYGDSDTPAQMPDPTTIMELLTFGDAIIITDNGDGTWSARGSYDKIYMVDGEDGVFQIDDVEHEDFGDGTFGISTTGV
jgi:hypothetical protein